MRKAHLIEENDLMEDVLNYIKLCRALCEVISTYDMRTLMQKRKHWQKNDRTFKKKFKTEEIN